MFILNIVTRFFSVEMRDRITGDLRPHYRFVDNLGTYQQKYSSWRDRITGVVEMGVLINCISFFVEIKCNESQASRECSLFDYFGEFMERTTKLLKITFVIVVH